MIKPVKAAEVLDLPSAANALGLQGKSENGNVRLVLNY